MEIQNYNVFTFIKFDNLKSARIDYNGSNKFLLNQ